eukprot:3371755-Pyramimonas_sp.AAC.1
MATAPSRKNYEPEDYPSCRNHFQSPSMSPTLRSGIILSATEDGSQKASEKPVATEEAPVAPRDTPSAIQDCASRARRASLGSSRRMLRTFRLAQDGSLTIAPHRMSRGSSKPALL